MKITRTSRISAETNVMEIDVTLEQIAEWEGGMLIQDAMPNITSDEREFIMTGITPQEWDSMMGIEEWVTWIGRINVLMKSMRVVQLTLLITNTSRKYMLSTIVKQKLMNNLKRSSQTMARKNELQMFEKISITKDTKKKPKHNDDWKRARKLLRKTKLNIQERSFV